MQKIYLLLRNNCQTGPFTLEELVQLNLQPSDLIWVEEQSTSWSYPQDIEALQALVSFDKQLPQPTVVTAMQLQEEKEGENNARRKNGIFVAMPSHATNKHSIATATKAPDDAANKFYPPLTPVYPLKDTRTVEPGLQAKKEETVDDALLTVRRQNDPKKQHGPQKAIIAACLVASLAFIAWKVIAFRTNENGKNEVTPTTAKPSPHPVPYATNDEETTAGNISLPATEQNYTPPLPPTQKQVKSITATRQNKPKVNKQKSPAKQTKPVVETSIPSTISEKEFAPADKEEKVIVQDIKKSETIGAEPPKERKKLRDKFFDLFKKKPKPEADKTGG